MVGQSRLAQALPGSVHATHDGDGVVAKGERVEEPSRQILNHWTIREALPMCLFFRTFVVMTVFLVF